VKVYCRNINGIMGNRFEICGYYNGPYPEVKIIRVIMYLAALNHNIIARVGDDVCDEEDKKIGAICGFQATKTGGAYWYVDVMSVPECQSIITSQLTCLEKIKRYSANQSSPSTFNCMINGEFIGTSDGALVRSAFAHYQAFVVESKKQLVHYTGAPVFDADDHFFGMLVGQAGAPHKYVVYPNV